MNGDTIFALSSGPPPAAIAVVRISGPGARAALERIIGRLPPPRRATLARLRNPEDGEVIDEGLVLWLPAPASETGEDVVELHLHGGRAVVAATLAALGKLPGFRHAEAGEFTRRAFERGRMDLTAVEGLADLVAAETEMQRRQALRHLQGLLGERAEDWRQRLIRALALVEAAIDFSDEEDVPRSAMANGLAITRPLADEIAGALSGQGERVREGLRVAIAGPPNAGKSTLFNRLARRDAAIVSPFPGTTRDVLELHLDLGGVPVTVLDTAGIRPSDDPIEQEGIRRAMAQAERADLVLWVVDAAGGIDPAPAPTPHWLILNKCDLPEARQPVSVEADCPAYRISCRTGEGCEEVVQALVGYARSCVLAEPALVTRQRQRDHLASALAALREAEAAALRGGHEEIVAEQVRMATRSLGKLLGRVDVEDVLDVIFREFCIGK